MSILDELLTSLGDAHQAASLDEIRAMFATYEKPEMPTLSSEIEAMRFDHVIESPRGEDRQGGTFRL